MPHPSSTSSSEHHPANDEHEHGFRALLASPTLAGVITLAILLLIRLAAAVSPSGALTSILDGWTVDYPFAHAWNRLERTRTAPPPWLVLGSSRMGLGLDPDVMRTELGIEKTELEKLTMAAGTPWEWDRLFEINPSFLPRAGDVMVVDVGAWQFNLNRPERFGNRFDRLADPGTDTWRTIEGTDYAREFFLALWPFARYGSSPSDWAQAAATTAGVRSWATHDTEWDSVEARAQKAGVAHNMLPENTYTDHFRDFMWMDFVEDAYRDLAAQAETHGYTLVFVRPPTANDYTQRIFDNTTSAEAYARLRSLMDELAQSPNVVYIEFMTAEDTGVSEDGFFIDYGHMTRAGGGHFTKALVDRMRDAGIVKTTPGEVSEDTPPGDEQSP